MKRFLLAIGSLLGSFALYAQHPCLLFTPQEVHEIREARGTVPAFDKVLAELFREADATVNAPVCVPAPAGGGGGTVHEQHKANQYALFRTGIAYQLTGDKKYARYAAGLLEAYAQLYPALGYHPVRLSPVPGRLFWQTLNESVWLVHAAVAYDCIYDALPAGQRARIENDLLIPMARFIMEGTPDNRANRRSFDKMHNHATWATAAVGMTGMALSRETFVKKALYGSDETGRLGGFIRQLDNLFSPDGYFTEGAYYQRYAIWPFVLFARCIDRNAPELRVFEYRDRILPKALDALIRLSYNGEFFHFNDALPKGLSAQELVYAVDILYQAHPENKTLLSVASRYQHTYLPTSDGLRVARDIARGEAVPPVWRSCVLRDGRNGDEGGIAVIRPTDPKQNSALTLKATSHGLSHGHFDKLAIAYYDNGNEILPDYGASRFLNIEAKNKGHYTRENQSFAKQTIAHNTLTVDETSHFNGDIRVSSRHHSEILYSDFERTGYQITAGKETNAYPGVEMKRTVAYVTVPFLPFPLLLDVLQVCSEQEHYYDYPLWYKGHFVSVNFPYTKAVSELKTLGSANGYQHIWVEAWGQNDRTHTSAFTFVNRNRFYTLSTATSPRTELKLLRLGAGDPDFNLRNETCFLVREKGRKNHTFATCIETHGEYDIEKETSAGLTPLCEEISILTDTPDYTVVQATYRGGHSVTLCLSNANHSGNRPHNLEAAGSVYSWKGPYGIFIK